MRYRFHITDVFTRSAFAGNPLAVLPEADGISAAGMQHIAREFNFAETTFVVTPTDPRFNARVRIFTPRAEMQFAGHPTIGTACALVRGGHVADVHTRATVDLLLQEGIGPIAATVTRTDDAFDAMFSIDARLEQPTARVDTRAAAQVLRLAHNQVLKTFLAGIGVNFTFAQLIDRAAVDAAALDHAAWADRMATTWAPQLFIFAHEPADPARLYARMFAPALGVPEDPATGSACAALAAVMATRSDAASGVASILITQGEAMGRRSEIRARAERTENGISVSVGGSCTHVAEGEIEVPAEWLER